MVNSPTAMLKMYETPHAKASMMTANVMRKRRTSFIMWLMLKMMGPKYFEAIPTCVKARTKAIPRPPPKSLTIGEGDPPFP